ncbi:MULTISPECIES: hypothetical protein [unclassified Nocardiopsis]|uniref:hypothetical protein n=1 Tax=unclassified Nocardiopsis TaxID=2649073 RepID=UPI0011614726|nr:hypothetical protein [Nocardiopsis sp. TSRI0078]
MHALTDTGAAGAGRDPASTRRVYDVAGTIAGGASTGFLHGPAVRRVEQLTGLVPVQGTDTFVFGPDEDPVRRVERFAAEVASAVREAVRRGRA